MQVSTSCALGQPKGLRSTGSEAKGFRALQHCLKEAAWQSPGDQASAADQAVLDMFCMLNWLQNKYIYNTISPGHGVPPVTWWGTESQAPASCSAAC